MTQTYPGFLYFITKLTGTVCSGHHTVIKKTSQITPEKIQTIQFIFANLK